MHVLDGFLNLTTSAATGVVAVGGIAAALRAARNELDDRTAPLPGLACVAGLVSVPVAAMVGWHTVIGLGEGVITALVVSSVLAVRPDLVRGARPYRSPADLQISGGGGHESQILSFMLRYLEVVTAEMQKMRIARESRGFRGGSLKSWPVLARSAGALFIRSYERGERVHLAMLSRGYAGSLPDSARPPLSRVHVVTALALPTAAAVVLLTAYLV